jgi:hypothetical protein
MYFYNSNFTLLNDIVRGRLYVRVDSGAFTYVFEYSNIESLNINIVPPGTANVTIDPSIIGSDPLFVPGTYGNYYLSQTAASQVSNSPCLDKGSGTASSWGLDTRTTRTDNVADSGAVDMGYHYPVP